ncbi:MAG: right-handed parallel beta-helix repeat-containing protein [Saprospiraceae bacterium]|nr:right-handed parallel beta-helix repeat-containing protein [Saprospiraceae bacterium]
MIVNIRKYFIFFILFIFLLSCKDKDEYDSLYSDQSNWTNIEQNLQSQIIAAHDGDTIRLHEGHFWFTKSLIIDNKKDITFTGAGMNKTFLSFKGQEEGAEGIRIANCSGFTISDMTVLDSNGDNIKATNTNGIRFIRVRADWSGGAKESNGSYAFYPVLCKNVLIEECIAARASDAGIYVGQSDTVIIRNNRAFQNVAGIESENSNYVDIYHNHAYDNTGGILVFDLPGLTQYGSKTRIFDNQVIENNHENFAPKGNIVGMVPPGTGFMILSTRQLEIFDNQVLNNKTIGTSIISYELVSAIDNDKKENERSTGKFPLDTLYNPYPDSIYIYNNNYANTYWFPNLGNEIGKLIAWKFPFNTPFILWDGFVKSPAKDINLCLNQPNITFANINGPENLKNIKTGISNYLCKGQQLVPVVLLFKNEIITSIK